MTMIMSRSLSLSLLWLSLSSFFPASVCIGSFVWAESPSSSVVVVAKAVVAVALGDAKSGTVIN